MLPGRTQPTRKGDRVQRLLQLLELLFGQLFAPVLHDVDRGLVGGGGAGPTASGQDQQSRPAVGRVDLALRVAALHEVVDQLSCSLLRDAEVRGELGGGRPCPAEPGEGEAMHRAAQ